MKKLFVLLALTATNCLTAQAPWVLPRFLSQDYWQHTLENIAPHASELAERAGEAAWKIADKTGDAGFAFLRHVIWQPNSLFWGPALGLAIYYGYRKERVLSEANNKLTDSRNVAQKNYETTDANLLLLSKFATQDTHKFEQVIQQYEQRSLESNKVIVKLNENLRGLRAENERLSTAQLLQAEELKKVLLREEQLKQRLQQTAQSSSTSVSRKSFAQTFNSMNAFTRSTSTPLDPATESQQNMSQQTGLPHTPPKSPPLTNNGQNLNNVDSALMTVNSLSNTTGDVSPAMGSNPPAQANPQPISEGKKRMLFANALAHGLGTVFQKVAENI